MGRKGAGGRARLVDGFGEETGSWPTLADEEWELCRVCRVSDDFLDALLAAVAVRAARVGCREPIPPADHSLLAEEGWIALPQAGSLKKLA